MAPEQSLALLGLRNLPAGFDCPIKSNSVAGFDSEIVRADALGTRIVVHDRFPKLVQRFIEHKRLHGSSVERAFYHAGWTWREQISRLVEKRAVVFLGANDATVLRSGKRLNSASLEWDRVGTDNEALNEHLSLEEYLSYDEIMLSSLIGVSGPSFFINDGRRRNMGRPGKEGSFEPRGIIMGLVGARFEREDRMDSSYILKEAREPRQHPELRNIFYEFFGRSRDSVLDFDINMYKGRIRITADILLLEANDRAKTAGKKAYVYVVGLGLGVWAWGNRSEQALPYVQAFMESLEELSDDLSHIGTVEFAWIDEVLGWKKRAVTFGAAKRVIDVRFSRRSPAEKLHGPDENQLLVLSYAWDGNAFPGNEYWVGSLTATGDPAAACMSTISELHNPLVNPGFLDRIEVRSVQ
ncbi:hypothetical protein F4861DRAFT_537022 [Xylaria intraflava]|nr:hypothetical protein F4861DRAFT_537022 [Xylaria intraflava]